MYNGSAAQSDELPLPRKKAVRVSFDETNVVVGQAAAPVATDSPVPQSPQQSKKSWFSSIGRGKKKDIPVVEDSDDEVMKPRPALPSFGSVREKKNRDPVEERPLVKPAEPVDSTPPALPSPPLFTTPTGEIIEFPLGQSNDHKIGAIISQDASSKNEANISKSREPLPPQVLSVEGSGYSSDTDSSSVSGQRSPVGVIHDTKLVEELKPVEEVRPAKLEIDPAAIDRESANSTPTGFKANSDVPEIAVFQATPTLEHSEKKEWPDMEHMPGGWGGSSASDSGSAIDEDSTAIEHGYTDPTTPATIGIAEPLPAEAEPRSPVLGHIAAENTHTIPAIMEETEESDTSVYSDAAEDLSDGDGDGFQSLNAVVESPILTSAIPGLAITTPPESPTVRTAKERAYKKSQLSRKTSEPDLDEGWEKAQEYWKGLSEEKRRQLEQEARDEAEVAEDSDSTIEAQTAPKPKKKKTTQPIAAEVPILRQPIPNERTYMIQPGSKAGLEGPTTTVMRSSMRAEPISMAEEPHIRKSVRGPGSMRGSLRNGEARSSMKKNRPVSLPAPKADQAAAKMHVRNLSAASAAAASGAAQRDMAPKTAPVLRRRSSGDSDSSFKRARKSNEGSSMRRSMRGPVDERPQSPVQSSRFSIRSLSPTGSAFRRPFSSGGAPPVSGNHMRSSLRSSVGPTPSLRGPKPEKSSRLPGFGRSSSSKPAPKPIRQRSSRFADSSDEEDVRPSFRSRFVDSDSDDEDGMPAPRAGGFSAGTMRANAPVRQISKRSGVEEGDSSDLPDSDDEKKSPKLPSSPGLKLAKNRQNGTAALTGTQGLTLASGSLRRSGSGRETMGSPTTTTTIAGATARPSHTRRGSFMSILRRKKPDPASKVRKSDAESPARRDTPLERSKSDLAAVKRQESYTSASGLRPSTPKLQKKNAPSWPLVSDSPPNVLGEEVGRPFTADAGDEVVGDKTVVNGKGTTNGEDARPEIGTRRFTATGLGDVDLSAVTKGRKKKKFGTLRRMFRLDD
jgi:hypothetical protein